MFAAWSAAEVPRYTFLLWKLVTDREEGKVRQPGISDAASSAVPYWLTWLRYSMFIVLYPLGFGGELGQIIAALPFIAAHRPFSIEMPNAANFSFELHSYLLVCIALYAPLAPLLFSSMSAQRRSKLVPISAADAARAEKVGKEKPA